MWKYGVGRGHSGRGSQEGKPGERGLVQSGSSERVVWVSGTTVRSNQVRTESCPSDVATQRSGVSRSVPCRRECSK